MDNPHFQRSILTCLKNSDLTAVRLQAEQVDESVPHLAVEGYLQYHFESRDDDDEDVDSVHSLHPHKPTGWLGWSSKSSKMAFTIDSSGNSASEFTSASESPLSPESGFIGFNGFEPDAVASSSMQALCSASTATAPHHLLSQGFHPKLCSPRNSEMEESPRIMGNGKVNLLHFAARGWRFSSLHLVKNLVDEGVNILAVDSMNRSPLHYAAASLQMESLRFIISLPTVDLNAQCKMGYTPLHCLFLARRGPRQSLGVYRRESLPQLKNENRKLILDFLNILTIHGVSSTPWNLHLVDNLGRSLLHLAATAWIPEVTEFLVQVANISPFLLDKQGNFPFHYALATLDLKTCEYLLSLNLHSSPYPTTRNSSHRPVPHCLPTSMEDLIPISQFYDGFSLDSPMAGTPLLHAVFIQGLRSEDNPYTFQKQGESCGALIYGIVKRLLESGFYDPNQVCKISNTTLMELLLRTAYKYPVQMQSFGVDIPKMILLLLQNGASACAHNHYPTELSPVLNPSHENPPSVISPISSPSKSSRGILTQSLLKLSLLSRDLMSLTLLYAAGASLEGDEEERTAISQMMQETRHSAPNCRVFKRFSLCFLCLRFHHPPSLLQIARRKIRQQNSLMGGLVAMDEAIGFRRIPPKHILYLKLHEFDSVCNDL